MPDDGTVLIEDARMIFRNFEGKEGQYNRKGDKNFSVLLDNNTADQMVKDGWNVKWLKAREEGEEEQPYIQVTVNFKGRPPMIAMITSRGRTNLGEDEVELLDWADIERADMILNPYEWEVNEKSGVKAYLKSLFVTVREDELELRYSEVPDVNSRGELEVD